MERHRKRDARRMKGWKEEANRRKIREKRGRYLSPYVNIFSIYGAYPCSA